MNLHELKRLVAKGESDRVEFKKSTGQRAEAAKTVCAMLNGLGGFVVFGVGDKGELIGQDIGQRTVAEVTHELARIEPPAFPEIETIAFKEGRSFIVLRVPGGGGLFSFDGRYYQRVGPTTRQMGQDEQHRRLLERYHATSRWENQPVPAGVTIADLDTEEIRLTLRNAIDLGRLKAPGKRDIKSILQGLELIRDGKLLNAAVALYGKSDQLRAHFPQFSIRLARFRGVNRLADFSDNRQYWGHAFDLLRRGETFLIDHVPIAGRVVEGRMRREDRPLYPPRATREALANAICHRDYVAPGGAIAVAMYDDHLEIVSPGGFHLGMEPAKLVMPHESRPWNPIIANVFYRAGIIERWGMGTLKMIDWRREFDCPAPEWKEQAGSVYVTFHPAPWFEEGKPGRQGKVESKVESEVGCAAWSTTARTLDLLVGGPLSKSQIAKGLGKAAVFGQIHDLVNRLLGNGWIERTIPNKPQSRLQRYRLTEQGRAVLQKLKV
jgi:ATP-dependent DNA helicase RecG